MVPSPNVTPVSPPPRLKERQRNGMNLTAGGYGGTLQNVVFWP